jgi:hypothetical protein
MQNMSADYWYRIGFAQNRITFLSATVTASNRVAQAPKLWVVFWRLSVGIRTARLAILTVVYPLFPSVI